MTTLEEINSIVSKRYGNYKRSQFKDLKKAHDFIKTIKGDAYFLDMLRKLEVVHPKPENYQLPTIK